MASEALEPEPMELDDQATELYIAAYYPVIDVRGLQELAAMVAVIAAEVKNTSPSTIKNALYSTAIFRVYCELMPAKAAGMLGPTANDHWATLVTAAMGPMITQIRNLELVFRMSISGPSMYTFNVVRATSAMSLLAAKCPELVGFSIHIEVDVSGVRDDKAKAGQWVHTRSSDDRLNGPATTSPGPLPPTLKHLLVSLLAAARDRGPGKSKILKISVQRPRSEYIKDDEDEDEDYQHSAEWKPWDCGCEGIEFGPRENVHDVLQKAINDCTLQPWTG